MDLMLTLIHQEPTGKRELEHHKSQQINFHKTPLPKNSPHHKKGKGSKTHQSSINSRPSKKYSKIESYARMESEKDLSTGFNHIV
jgi:hypothetical protein